VDSVDLRTLSVVVDHGSQFLLVPRPLAAQKGEKPIVAEPRPPRPLNFHKSRRLYGGTQTRTPNPAN
jgi:hypothetical protein